MSTVIQQGVSFILDNIADAIEGGNSYRGSGTAWKGVCGLQSNEEGDDVTVTLGAGAHSTTSLVTTAATISGYTRAADNANLYATTDLPPWFAVGTSGTAGNVGAGRKITAWSASAITLDVAYPSTPASGDVFGLRQGFKRLRDGVDIEEADAGGSGDGFDRCFHISCDAGERLPMYGNGTEQYKAALSLRLRINKRARARKSTASAFENMLILRSVITKPSLRDGTYMMALLADGSAPKIIKDDAAKLVIEDTFELQYRISSQYL